MSMDTNRGLWMSEGSERQRIYRLMGHGLKPIHDWVKSYEESWSQRFDRMDTVLAELKEMEDGGNGQ